MVVLSVICGVLLMMGGIACLFNPGATFFATGYFIAILLLIYGIVGIVNVVRKRAPAIGLITYILAVIVGIFAIFRPENALVMDTILAYLVGGSCANVCPGKKGEKGLGCRSRSGYPGRAGRSAYLLQSDDICCDDRYPGRHLSDRCRPEHDRLRNSCGQHRRAVIKCLYHDPELIYVQGLFYLHFSGYGFILITEVSAL